MGKDVGDERRPEPSDVQGRMREADRGAGEKTERNSVTLACLCSSRSATRANLLKRREKRNRPNTSICGYFAVAGKAQQTIAPPLHGGGRGFESPRLQPRKGADGRKHQRPRTAD